MRSIKLTILKGALPEQGTDWWTQEDWARHSAYVKELKGKGEYLKEEEITIHYQPYLSVQSSGTPYKNFGLLIPNKIQCQE